MPGCMRAESRPCLNRCIMLEVVVRPLPEVSGIVVIVFMTLNRFKLYSKV